MLSVLGLGSAIGQPVGGVLADRIGRRRTMVLGLLSSAATLLVLGERSYLPYDHLIDAHRAALGDLLEVVVVPGGHSVLWDALEETAEAIADFLER